MKSIDLKTKEELYFRSMHACQQNLGINAGLIKMVCEKINNNNCKTRFSKDGKQYTFDFFNKEDLPDNFIESSTAGEKRDSLSERKIYFFDECKVIIAWNPQWRHKRRFHSDSSGFSKL